MIRMLDLDNVIRFVLLFVRYVFYVTPIQERCHMQHVKPEILGITTAHRYDTSQEDRIMHVTRYKLVYTGWICMFARHRFC